MLKEFVVRFDARLTVAITGWPSWLRVPFLVVTTIGQPMVLVCFVVGVASALIGQPVSMPIVYALGAGLTAMLINTTLKHFIHRPRPDTLYVSNMYFKSSSFPSGHAFGTMVIYGLLAYVTSKYLAAPLSSVLATAFAGLIILIGVSRVYLGAHYPTDVLAGWAFGSVMLWLIIA